jgi:hypothetical protein
MNRFYNVHTVWLAMMAITVTIYVMAEMRDVTQLVMGIIFLTTLLKGSFIVREFMELKGVAFIWRVLMYGWLWSTCLVIATTYVISS